MKVVLIVISFFFVLNLTAQPEKKGRSLFFGVNLGTKIANKHYAGRYSGIYQYYGTDRTELDYTINTPRNYDSIKFNKLDGYDFQVPFDAYSQNIRYTPGLLTGVTIGYQISPNLQVSADGNFNKLKVRDVFSIQVFDNSTFENRYELGEIYAEESRFEGRFNFDYVSEGDKVNFIFGGSGIYTFWRIDKHIATFQNYDMLLFNKFSTIPAGETNIVRGNGWGIGLNLGIEYRINNKIVSQIMYQPYQAFVDYGIYIPKRFLLQHDITIRFLWK
jgi:hypothetical protein